MSTHTELQTSPGGNVTTVRPIIRVVDTLDEPADGTRLVRDEGENRLTVIWRDDRGPRNGSGDPGERWYATDVRGPLLWGEVVKRARAVYAVTDYPLAQQHDIDPIVEGLKRAFSDTFRPGRISGEVVEERRRQREKFGELRYPDGTGRPGDEETAKALKAACKANTPAEDNWRDILAEEVAEAFAETDPKALRTELIQVAAVAQAWAEDIDRREGI